MILKILFLFQLWEVNSGKDGKATVDFLSSLTRHTRTVNCVRFSPDGRSGTDFDLTLPFQEITKLLSKKSLKFQVEFWLLEVMTQSFCCGERMKPRHR